MSGKIELTVRVPEEMKTLYRASSVKNILGGAEQAGAANSGEVAYKAEISDEARQMLANGLELKEVKNPSKESVMTVSLLSEMKKVRFEASEAGEPVGTELEALAKAYDRMHKNLNENSENSNKHGKFLDEALKAAAKFVQTREAQMAGRDLTGEGMYSSRTDELVEGAKKQGEIFAVEFLKGYKKEGLGALETALEKLNSMKETDSISSISYKDFQILAENTKGGYYLQNNDIVLSQSVTDSLLGDNNLSDYVKNWLQSFR